MRSQRHALSSDGESTCLNVHASAMSVLGRHKLQLSRPIPYTDVELDPLRADGGT